MNQPIHPEFTPIAPTTRIFPAEGTHLSLILSDTQQREAFHAQLKRYNPLIVGLYKSGLLPLFGLGRTVMLLTTRGRKSRNLRSTPIGYFRIGGVIHLFSAWGKSSNWYKNMTTYPEDIWIQIGLRKWPVRAEVLQEPKEIEKALEKLISESPDQARTLLGWDSGQDRLENADFTQIIKKVLVIRFIAKTGKVHENEFPFMINET